MKQAKKYIILHIETGQFIKSRELKVDGCGGICFSVLSSWYQLTVNLKYFEMCGILRKDFSLKRDAIYFKDKVSATTFLRDIYLPQTNSSGYSGIRRFHRNEFEIVEV